MVKNVWQEYEIMAMEIINAPGKYLIVKISYVRHIMTYLLKIIYGWV
jgi:hypothetical protein